MKLSLAVSAAICVPLLGGCGGSDPPSNEPRFSATGTWLGSCEGKTFRLQLTESPDPYLPGLSVQGNGYCLPFGPGIVFQPVAAEGWNTSATGTPELLLNLGGACLPTGGGQFRGSWSGRDAMTGVFEGRTDIGLSGGPFYPLTLQRQ